MNIQDIMGFLVTHASATQLTLFASVMIGMWLLEEHVSAQPTSVKLWHSSGNALFILTALPIQFVMMMLCLTLADWVTVHHWGLLYLLPNADSPWLKYGLMFLALDFLDYVYHFTMHQFGPFWRFHRLHHMDRAVDVTTTVREHPGETLIRNGYLILWVFLCGASIEVLVLRQTFGTVANILSHTTFLLAPRPARILGWLFITPNLHHAHHHYQMPATNYGDVFSIWDRLLGSYRYRSGEDIVYGIDTQSGIASPGDRGLRVAARTAP